MSAHAAIGGANRSSVGASAVVPAPGPIPWSNWHLVETYVGTIQNVVIVAVAAAVAWFVLSRVRRARRGRKAPADQPVESPGQRGTVYRGGAG